MYIPGVKFEEHYSNISGDILDSVFYYLSGTITPPAWLFEFHWSISSFAFLCPCGPMKFIFSLPRIAF